MDPLLFLVCLFALPVIWDLAVSGKRLRKSWKEWEQFKQDAKMRREENRVFRGEGWGKFDHITVQGRGVIGVELSDLRNNDRVKATVAKSKELKEAVKRDRDRLKVGI